MQSIKKILAKQFSTFYYFYSYLGYRIFLALSLSILVAVLDGFGLSMFLPLLQMVGGNEQVDPEAMGNLSFLIDGIKNLGFELNLFAILIFMLFFFILKGGVHFVTGTYKVILLQSFVKKLRLKILSALNTIKFKVFMTTDAGRIQNTMSGEIEKISQGYNMYMSAFQQGVMVAVYMGFAFIVDLQFALLVSIGGILTNILYKQIYKRTKGKSKEFTSDSHSYQGQIIQHVANFKYLKATDLVNIFSDRLKKSILAIENSRKKMGIYSAILEAAREPMLIFVVASVIIIQTQLLNASLGPIILSLLFFYRALTALLNLQNSWNRFLEVSGSVENVRSFQNELNRNQSQNGTIKIANLSDNIELKNASFIYENTPILSNINLNIIKNETLAFVGESGSGKTTLVNILAGLMPVDEGGMFIDGQKVSELDIRSYQSRIGYITQEPVIFNDTIFNNVTFWDEFSDQNYNRFRHALQRASILGYVEKLPKTYNTTLGNNGVNLSGGQKQRISIARELYKNIDILIMDEATSALDTETESSIQENIDALKGEYTLLIVAHRLSTIKNADRIVLMKEGEIENIGNYADLVQNNKEFERMVKLQEL
jgi:subfamily B ATP-binding cassette protein MsbA